MFDCREMEKFFSKIDICRELFGPLKTSAYSRQLSGLDTQQVNICSTELITTRGYSGK